MPLILVSLRLPSAFMIIHQPQYLPCTWDQRLERVLLGKRVHVRKAPVWIIAEIWSIGVGLKEVGVATRLYSTTSWIRMVNSRIIPIGPLVGARAGFIVAEASRTRAFAIELLSAHGTPRVSLAGC
jgi:hypothetical protein